MTSEPCSLESILLDEYQNTWVELEPDDFAYIERTLARRIGISRPVRGGGHLLNPGPFAGIVVLPSGRRIVCRPKAPVRNFFAMLAVAFDLDPDFMAETTTFERIDEVFEFVIGYFADLVDRRISRGLYRAYVEREDNLLAVRGRIAIGEDVRRNHVLRHRTYCRFTELTWDIPENQIVRQVAHMTAGWVTGRALRDELRRIDRVLGEVTPVRLSAQTVDRFSYGRLNDDYRPIHRLCRLFIDGASVSEDEGVFDFRAFLFDMNALFERFVTRLLQHGAPAHLEILDQRTIHLGTRRQVEMLPDIVVRRDGRAILSIDCKYKRLDAGRFKNHDQYQILAYCTALDVDRGLLVYPRHEDALDDEIQVRNSAVRVQQISIDLGGDRGAFAFACQKLVAEVCDLTM